VSGQGTGKPHPRATAPRVAADAARVPQGRCGDHRRGRRRGDAGFLAYSDERFGAEEAVVHRLPIFRVQPRPCTPCSASSTARSPRRWCARRSPGSAAIERFVHKGDRVLNQAQRRLDRQPEQAANTNPTSVRAGARLCARPAPRRCG